MREDNATRSDFRDGNLCRLTAYIFVLSVAFGAAEARKLRNSRLVWSNRYLQPFGRNLKNCNDEDNTTPKIARKEYS
jgi:hypothetical protein